MINNQFFPEIHGNFGFGCMRLPMKGEAIDIEQMKQMADAFLEAGFNYFDTAHGYHNGLSETSLREAVTSRYARDKYVLTNKLTAPYFNKKEDIRPFFEQQLGWCGVDYFDFYLMHAQDATNFAKFKSCQAYETALELKSEGKIHHFGISFHDKPEVLDRILTEYPQIEIVQIQFNYLDYDNASVQSAKNYEVCEKHGKPVLVMEPVRGGNLVNLPDNAQKIFDDLGQYSNAGYAIRFAASYPNICTVLSGMSSLEQMRDNISTMQNFTPLTQAEHEAINKVRGIFADMQIIPCTSCHYCVYDSKCPKNIKIPELFSCYNLKKTFNSWNQDYYYSMVLTINGGKASECIKCGKCEKVCPQHLEIRRLLEDVATEFEVPGKIIET